MWNLRTLDIEDLGIRDIGQRGSSFKGQKTLRFIGRNTLEESE